MKKTDNKMNNEHIDKALQRVFEKKKDPDEFGYMCLGYLALITILLTILLA